MAPAKGKKRVVITRPPLDFSKLVVSKAAPEAMARHKPTRGERDQEQAQIDTLVCKAWDAWKAAGKPEAWLEQPGMAVTLPEGQLETFKWRLTRAGNHYDLKVRIGSVDIVEAEDGKYADVVFTVIDKPTAKADEPDNPEEADEPEETGEETDETGEDSDEGSDTETGDAPPA